MDKPNFDFVFVVLVYRNTGDLEDFFSSNSIPCSRVIVVNSFYDKESDALFQQIARAHGADFISVPNKGYGYGNNRGCEYALEHYDFKYLVISNADITIETLDVAELARFGEAIIAPKLINLKGKNQNPHWPFKISRMELKWVYNAYLKRRKRLFYLFAVLSRIRKNVFLLFNKMFGRTRIFAPHGAFTVFSSSAIRKLYPLYDENIFLFCEEGDVAFKSKQLNIPVFYSDRNVIHHKEDGSISLENHNLFELGRESYFKFYNHWFGDGRTE